MILLSLSLYGDVMKIEDKINKYLVEKVSREDAMRKLMKVINSVTDEKQLQVAIKMANNYHKMYGEKWYNDITNSNEPTEYDIWGNENSVFNQLLRATTKKSDQLKFLKAQQK